MCMLHIQIVPIVLALSVHRESTVKEITSSMLYDVSWHSHGNLSDNLAVQAYCLEQYNFYNFWISHYLCKLDKSLQVIVNNNGSGRVATSGYFKETISVYCKV